MVFPLGILLVTPSACSFSLWYQSQVNQWCACVWVWRGSVSKQIAVNILSNMSGCNQPKDIKKLTI